MFEVDFEILRGGIYPRGVAEGKFGHVRGSIPRSPLHGG